VEVRQFPSPPGWELDVRPNPIKKLYATETETSIAGVDQSGEGHPSRKRIGH